MGGVWPSVADAVRVEAETIASGRRSVEPPPLAECDELARRRKVLGLTLVQFAKVAKLHKSTVYTVECGVSGADALRRYRAAIDQLEAERETKRRSRPPLLR
jgi:hypothetical protein